MRAIADLVFFPSCLSCKAPGVRFLCSACEQALPRLNTCCGRCARPLRRPAAECSDCRTPKPSFRFARAAVAYRGVGRDVLMTFKLGGERRAARAMAGWMARALNDVDVDVVTFVPATRASMVARGFNPAEELGRALARDLRIPCAGLLRKVRTTADQAELGREQRRRNVAGAFRGRPCGGRVLLVDDVMTTGATADACARALRRAGARDVIVVTFARAGD